MMGLDPRNAALITSVAAPRVTGGDHVYIRDVGPDQVRAEHGDRGLIRHRACSRRRDRARLKLRDRAEDLFLVD